MSKVTSIDKHRPHMHGSAKCLNCSYKWTSVSPIGVSELECPSCGSMKGVYTNFASDEEDLQVWQCNCGNVIAWNITPDGIMCAHCGDWQTFPE